MALMLIGPPSKAVLPIPTTPPTATVPATSVDGQSTSYKQQVSTTNVADSKPANVPTPPPSPKIKNKNKKVPEVIAGGVGSMAGNGRGVLGRACHAGVIWGEFL